jgi:uroporphyrinogen-III decarboxylase
MGIGRSEGAVVTSRERVQASFGGAPVDRMPVTVLYWPLCQQDHFAELADRPQSELHEWLYAEPEDHLRLWWQMMDSTPFDILQPQSAATRDERKRQRCTPHQQLADFRGRSGHARDYTANQTRYVFDRADVDDRVMIVPAADITASGVNDYLEALVTEVGETEFILSGGVIGTLYSCGSYVGMENIYPMLIEEPDLVHYLSSRILEQKIEEIRALVAAGGDAIFIDDATATSDMISIAQYEHASLPYITEMVREIQRLGRKAILIYFGGVADRLDQIVSTAADALSVETSMKGYVNDIAEIAARVGDRLTLFGNIDPVSVLERGSEEELEAEIIRQVAAGRKCGQGFIICTGSPITPGTPVSRVQRFIELSHKRRATESTNA